MLKIRSTLCVSVNGREYEFMCPTDSPLNDAIDANMQMNAFLLGRVEQAKQGQAAQEMPAVPEMPPVDDKPPQG